MGYFFNQKTAYEIGTGDWSSDVCSSDLSSVALYRLISTLAEALGAGLIWLEEHIEIGRASL